jgi:excisionase family DNA binding protein
MKNEERLLSVQEVSRILGVTVKCLYGWRWKRQHLPFVKVGSSLRVSEADLLSFIKRRKSYPCKS